MSDQRFNPIKSVNGVTIPVPSSYKYDLTDISANGAGRTEDTQMHKLRLAQLCKLELSWNALTTEEVSVILQAFNAEYFTIEYLDALTGQYRTSTFYAGDRTAPLYNAKLGYWTSLSFNITERTGWNV